MTEMKLAIFLKCHDKVDEKTTLSQQPALCVTVDTGRRSLKFKASSEQQRREKVL